MTARMRGNMTVNAGEFSTFLKELVNTGYILSLIHILPEKYMPEGLKKMYADRAKYPVSSGFQIAYAVDGVFPELTDAVRISLPAVLFLFPLLPDTDTLLQNGLPHG